ncbi:formylglycine-generating enzyme family protein [Agrobacterium vitis]|uniref:SUMF1/EgtB/PvdO family nonheme iron enzyme n=1 Tax=Allorhizobium ampelinum TaxID=3025782 RepID=UPI001F41B164|nr:SUMF1/EgtB/PvdO family nonheme iron enzyme [Allorhizobium ampelinum]MCF1449305.1 formylglycine-generating enzyme family protein [Allorhizobium ampelinum]
MATIAARTGVSSLSMILPALLLAALVGGLAFTTGLIGNGHSGEMLPGPQIVIVAPRTFMYRSDGDFTKGGFPIDGPLLTVAVRAPLTIMKFQVSVADYTRCVVDGACAAAENVRAGSDAVPVTGVNYDDAYAYAGWLSKKTGQVWRLPTDAEWAFAAGERFVDDGLGLAMDSRNPAIRWLADYEREAARKGTGNPAPQPQGTFGENAFGVADIGGNVWEWTQTCHRRVNIGEDGAIASDVPACGIYVTEGKHRAPMSSFIRDPKSGGCSVGTPPDNLGFRLVHDSRWYAPLVRAFEIATGHGA